MRRQISIREIAEERGYHSVHVQRLSREKGFPDPVRLIGRNKMFHAGAVADFFERRRSSRDEAR